MSKAKLVPRFGNGDDQSIELAKPFLEQPFALRLVDIDEERKAAERRLASQHGQQIGCRLEQARPDLGSRQAEAARQCRGGGTPPAVLRADDHRQRTRALPEPSRQPFDALEMPLRASARRRPASTSAAMRWSGASSPIR